jgi:pyrrolysine biosynthesis protein PylD
VASRLRGHEIQVERDLGKALEKHHLLFDGSPAAGFIEVRHIGPQTVSAAPGIPLGLTGEAYLLVQDRLIHDPLQIGVTTMLTEVLLNPEKRNERDRQVGG